VPTAVTARPLVPFTPVSVRFGEDGGVRVKVSCEQGLPVRAKLQKSR